MSKRAPRPEQRTADLWIVENGRGFQVPDELAVEEPLDIRLTADGRTTPLALTMRTPGADRELVAGFLVCEGIVRGCDDLVALEEGEEKRSVGKAAFVRAELRGGIVPSGARLERHFLASSACGVCGKSEMESMVLGRVIERVADACVSATVLYELPGKLRAAQSVFAATGGLHAAALFTMDGELVQVREDVGRHNALDKLIGWACLERRLPLREYLVMVSGRASYELVQKCSMAEIPVLCAVSAPTSLAVSFASRLGLTLVAFLRERRFNVYAGAERVRELAAAPA